MFKPSLLAALLLHHRRRLLALVLQLPQAPPPHRKRRAVLGGWRLWQACLVVRLGLLPLCYKNNGKEEPGAKDGSLHGGITYGETTMQHGVGAVTGN